MEYVGDDCLTSDVTKGIQDLGLNRSGSGSGSEKWSDLLENTELDELDDLDFSLFGPIPDPDMQLTDSAIPEFDSSLDAQFGSSAVVYPTVMTVAVAAGTNGSDDTEALIKHARPLSCGG